MRNEKKKPDMRQLLGSLKNLNQDYYLDKVRLSEMKISEQENEEDTGEEEEFDLGNRKSVSSTEIERERDKVQNYFDDLNVILDVEDIEIYENGVMLNGVIDSQVAFSLQVTPSEMNSGLEYEYLDAQTDDVEDLKKILNKLKTYYEQEFFPYWRDEYLEQR